jgi:hypothetical protein
MPTMLRGKLTFANAISLIALFIALGGSSYAAVRVGSRQIADNSVRGRDIRNNDLRSRDIRNGTVLGRDLRNGTVTGFDLRNGGVTAADVRNGSLRGAEIKHDSLTGGDVVESTLGTVPSAADAATLDGKSASAFLSADRLRTSPFVKLSAGQTKTVAHSGPFTWKAACADPGGGQRELTVTVESTEAGAVAADFNGQGSPVDPGSPVPVFNGQSSTPAYSIGFPATAIAPSGAQPTGFGWVAIMAGGADCGVKVNLIT